MLKIKSIISFFTLVFLFFSFLSTPVFAMRSALQPSDLTYIGGFVISGGYSQLASRTVAGQFRLLSIGGTNYGTIIEYAPPTLSASATPSGWNTQTNINTYDFSAEWTLCGQVGAWWPGGLFVDQSISPNRLFFSCLNYLPGSVSYQPTEGFATINDSNHTLSLADTSHLWGFANRGFKSVEGSFTSIPADFQSQYSTGSIGVSGPGWTGNAGAGYVSAGPILTAFDPANFTSTYSEAVSVQSGDYGKVPSKKLIGHIAIYPQNIETAAIRPDSIVNEYPYLDDQANTFSGSNNCPTTDSPDSCSSAQSLAGSCRCYYGQNETAYNNGHNTTASTRTGYGYNCTDAVGTPAIYNKQTATQNIWKMSGATPGTFSVAQQGNSNYWGNQGLGFWGTDQIGGAAWIQTTNKEGIIFPVSLSTGHQHYNCSTYSASGIEHALYFYTRAQFASVVGGAAEDSLTPVISMLQFPGLTYSQGTSGPYALNTNAGNSPDYGGIYGATPWASQYWINGTAYDPVAMRLYVAVQNVSGSNTAVYVYQVNDSSSSDTTAPAAPSGLSVM